MNDLKRIRSIDISNTGLNNFVDLPFDFFMNYTKEFRFSITTKNDTQVVAVMHRQVTQDIYEFIVKRGYLTKEQAPMVPALYIHGPRGVGKSYSLFEVVCLLREKPNNRVIYIPDCGGWFE